MQLRKTVIVEPREVVDLNEIIRETKRELAEKILEKPKINMGYLYENHARDLTRDNMTVEIKIKVKGKLVRPHIKTTAELEQEEKEFHLHYPESDYFREGSK